MENSTPVASVEIRTQHFQRPQIGILVSTWQIDEIELLFVCVLVTGAPRLRRGRGKEELQKSQLNYGIRTVEGTTREKRLR